MMSVSSKNLVLLSCFLMASLLLCLPSSLGRRNAGLAPMKVYVDNMQDADITIHCKSKDDDLGVHVLKRSQRYEWDFRVNFWGTTLFFCGVQTQWGSGTFDFYDAKRDYEGATDIIIRSCFFGLGLELTLPLRAAGGGGNVVWGGGGLGEGGAKEDGGGETWRRTAASLRRR
ncbi:hypothetical protein Tsubulata_003335 [Turnera subulata]|uniref:S-protein homolog n=1 Tax=Turnera subulata TaxID=218843 RepID=A0A9Q0JM25_9ROSI|nr:hypothetical protein Tsubulata_003335 [Turnera subulata]